MNVARFSLTVLLVLFLAAISASCRTCHPDPESERIYAQYDADILMSYQKHIQSDIRTMEHDWDSAERIFDRLRDDILVDYKRVLWRRSWSSVMSISGISYEVISFTAYMFDQKLIIPADLELFCRVQIGPGVYAETHDLFDWIKSTRDTHRPGFSFEREWEILFESNTFDRNSPTLTVIEADK